MKPCCYVLLLTGMLVSCTSDAEKEVREVAEEYAASLYTCNFSQAAQLCTSEGVDDVHWFASNLTEGDVMQLSTQEEGLLVTAEDVEITDSIAHVTVVLRNAMQVDSLEHAPSLGDVTRNLTLVYRDKSWKIKEG